MRDMLRRLPDQIVPALMRVLACLPAPRTSRLILRRAEDGRPPSWDASTDYDVLFRGRRIGRIWRYDYAGRNSGEAARHLWHWYWRHAGGRADAQGHADTLEQAMLAFRAAWDAGQAQSA